MQDAICLDLDALGGFERAVLRFSPQGTCTYANAAAQKLAGRKRVLGVTIAELIPDAEERRRVLDQLDRRVRGEASLYETAIVQPEEKVRIPVHVFAFPVVGHDGALEGSLAIVTDLRRRYVRQAMHTAIETLREGDEIFRAVGDELAKLLHFDDFRVTACSGDGNYLKMVYARDPETRKQYPVGWWRIPPDLKGRFPERPWIIDVKKEFAPGGLYHELAQKDVYSRRFGESGVLWCLNIPIISERGIRGFVALDSRNRPYGAEELDTCARLPLSEAAKMALNRRNEGRVNTCIDVVRQLGAKGVDVKQVAQLIVNSLVKKFEWDHVAIYERRHNTLEVLCQAGKEVPPELRVMPQGKGLIGRALAGNREINLPDVGDEALPDQDAYHPSIPGMKSSVAVPIPGEPTRWILNAESSLVSAFIEEEVGMLSLLMAEVGQVLDHMSLLETRMATLNAVKDAVIETDVAGVIRVVNPAGWQLLGAASASEVLGRHMRDFVADAQVSAALLETRGFPRRDVELRTVGGHVFPALLSGARLPDDVGGFVFVASDLRPQYEAERTSEVKDVFRHASLECRVPLAIASGWLNELARDRKELGPVVDRVLQQVRKADLPLERLLRQADASAAVLPVTAPVDLVQVVREVLDQFPAEEREDVELDLPSEAVHVFGGGDDLRFCVETSLSFAFRTKPQDKRVAVRMDVEKRSARLSVGGEWTPSLGADPAPAIRQRWRRTAASDLALADDLLADILGRAQGRFHSTLDGPLRLSIELPLAQGG